MVITKAVKKEIESTKKGEKKRKEIIL